LLFKAVVFRPDGHSDFMTGPEGYSTSVLAGDDPVTVVPDLVQSSRVGGELVWFEVVMRGFRLLVRPARARAWRSSSARSKAMPPCTR
jgi:hypothetical protein